MIVALRHIIINLLLCMPLLGALTSCQHQQELIYEPESHKRYPVYVDFDWNLHPDANPESMSLYLFPTDGGQPLRYEFAGRTGGQIQVPGGYYTAIAFNSDTENIILNNTGQLHTFELRLRDAYDMQGLSVRSRDVPRAPGTEDERMTSTAESLWIARASDVTVDASTPDMSLSLTPADAICHYNVNVTGVSNLAGVLSLSASLSGMSGSLYPHNGSVSSENVTMTFELTAASESTLSGSVHAFGHCGHSLTRHDDMEQALHQLTVYAVLTDGTRWYHTYDVTNHVHSSTSGTTNTITVDGLELPDVKNGGGFTIDINGWSSITQVLPM